MNLTKEDIELIRKYEDIKNRGFYCDGAELTKVYNRVLEKRATPTNCGSCIRQRINELVDALNRFERLSKQEVDNVPQEENKAVNEAGNEDMKARMARVRAARGKNK